MSDKKTDKLIVVTEEDLTMVGENTLSANQLAFLFKKTPKAHIYERPAKGGGKWQYVTGVYVKKVLNLMFGWDWDFEIVDEKFDLDIGQAYVKGKLTCRTGDKTIIKMQFGRADIKFKKVWDADLKKNIPSKLPLDIGNDLKAASTDALKKCASELGIASDVYAPNEFKEINIKEPTKPEEKLEEIKQLLEIDGLTIPEDDRMNIERIIEQKEVIRYDMCLKLLKNHLPKTKS